MTAREKALLTALRCFVGGYPNGTWRGLLHEEGCCGVNWRRGAERDGEECRCDGDYHEGLVSKVLPTHRPSKRTKRKA